MKLKDTQEIHLWHSLIKSHESWREGDGGVYGRGWSGGRGKEGCSGWWEYFFCHLKFIIALKRLQWLCGRWGWGAMNNP